VDDPVESAKIHGQFDKLDQDMTFNVMELAHLLAEVMHEERYTLLVEAQMHQADARLDMCNALDEVI
jgi:hypothetical protein